MGVHVGGCSYIDQQRNLRVAMSKGELMRAVSEKIVDPDRAAASIQEAEDARAEKALHEGRNC